MRTQFPPTISVSTMKRSAKSTFDSKVWKDRGVLSSSKSRRMPASRIAAHHVERKTAIDQIAIAAMAHIQA